jgi:electron transport complex protein RnfG
MKDIIKMALSLMIFSVAACVALAFVYQGTSKTIAERQKQELEAALQGVFPGADDFRDITPEIKLDSAQVSLAGDGKTGGAWEALSGGKAIGVAVQAVTAGFSDNITALAGVGSDGKISGVKILVITDTPGLGANAGADNYFVDKLLGVTFYGQFAGMSATPDGLPKIKVQKDGGDVVAITAATISSRAVALLVQTAVEAGSLWLEANR